MYETLFDTYLAITMLIVAAGAIVWIKRSELASTAARVQAMMKRMGLDPAPRESDDPETAAIMKEVRRRCGNCNHEGFCDRWLAGEESGDNAFCGNASVFRRLLSGHHHAA